MKEFPQKEAYILFGEQLNRIMKCLYVLKNRNSDVDGLSRFIEQLETMPSYDELLGKFEDDDENDGMESWLNSLGITLRDK
tara:strand:- start:31 stop:273 length:243 start_codon:yes stop_codon:yes gene_type:complete